MSVSLTTINGNVMIKSAVTDAGHFDAIIVSKGQKPGKASTCISSWLEIGGECFENCCIKGEKRNCALRNTAVRLARIWGLVRADLSSECSVSAPVCKLPDTW